KKATKKARKLPKQKRRTSRKKLPLRKTPKQLRKRPMPLNRLISNRKQIRPEKPEAHNFIFTILPKKVVSSQGATFFIWGLPRLRCAPAGPRFPCCMAAYFNR